MNKIILTGRLVADPEVRYTAGEKSVAVATFTLAVNRRFARREDPNTPTADFIRCKAFGKQAEFVEKYFHKGQKADLEGRVETGRYQNKDGQTVYTTDVIVENIEFGESKSASAGTTASAPTGQTKDTSFMNVPDDLGSDELPFN